MHKYTFVQKGVVMYMQYALQHTLQHYMHKYTFVQKGVVVVVGPTDGEIQNGHARLNCIVKRIQKPRRKRHLALIHA